MANKLGPVGKRADAAQKSIRKLRARLRREKLADDEIMRKRAMALVERTLTQKTEAVIEFRKFASKSPHRPVIALFLIG